MHIYRTRKLFSALCFGAPARALSDEHDTRSIVDSVESHSTGCRVPCYCTQNLHS